MVERCVRAVYRLDRVARAGVGPRRGSAGAVVEVDRGDLLAVHRAVRAVFLDVEETVVGAVLALPGAFIAVGTGSVLDVLLRVYPLVVTAPFDRYHYPAAISVPAPRPHTR